MLQYFSAGDGLATRRNCCGYESHGGREGPSSGTAWAKGPGIRNLDGSRTGDEARSGWMQNRVKK